MIIRYSLTRVAGLSPRVRGNHRREPGHRANVGSIPACAGEPLDMASGVIDPRVYPRVCGGTIAAVSEGFSAAGLSPRVRGNLRVRIVDPSGWRSIPACAGEPLDVLAGGG